MFNVNEVIISQRSSANTYPYWFAYRSNNRLSIGWNSTCGAQHSIQTTSATTITDTNWHHLVVVHPNNGTNQPLLYIDGTYKPTELVTGSATASMNCDATPTRIGSDNLGSWFKGTIDDVRISNIARSSIWIKFEYANISQTDNKLTWGPEE